MSVEKYLNEIQERASRATPGPWEAGGMDSGHSKYSMEAWVTTKKMGDQICSMDGLTRSQNEKEAKDDGEADAWFIAHARTDIPNLVVPLKEILELHAPSPDGKTCVACKTAIYPCATIKIMLAYLATED